MADFQSTVNDLTARIKGSGVLEVAAYSSAAAIALAASTAPTDSVSWKNVGSIEGLAIKENITPTQLVGDNADEETYVSAHSVTVSFTQRESLLEEVRAVMRGSFDVSGTPVAGSAVPAQSDVFASGEWAFSTFIPLPHQNGDGSSITITSITASTDGVLGHDPDSDPEWAPAVEDGVYGFIVLPAASIAAGTAQSLTVVYPYTPTASQTIYTGGKSTLPNFMARISNTDEDGKLVRFWFWKGTIDTGMDIAFKSDQEADPVAPQPCAATFKIDNNVTVKGKKIMKYYTERGI